jgi:polygalacturonase
MKKYILPVLFITIFATNLPAQVEYKASLFGCMSDGITLNTQSIQTAINTISSRGGGTLHFYVGRYLTGTVFLKDNVTIVLHEGATLVGVPSVYDYAGPTDAPKGIIVAEGQNNIGVTGSTPEYVLNTDVVGNGIIQGQGAQVVKNAETQIAKGYLDESLAQAAPALISFSGCAGVKITGLFLQGAAGDAVTYKDCRDVETARLLIDSRETPASSGIVANGCANLNVNDNFIRVSGKAIQTARSKGVKTKNNKTPKGKL